MAIIAKQSEKNFVPCPSGLQQAVCVDVVDLGMLKSSFPNKDGSDKYQHKVKLVWQSVDTDPDTHQRYLVQRRYTLSLDEKASLRKDLESWRGKPFTRDELMGFDLENLLGANCQLNVMHEQKNGETYANVTSIVPLGRGMQKIALNGYVRVQDRDSSDSDDRRAPELTDDDIPF